MNCEGHIRRKVRRRRGRKRKEGERIHKYIIQNKQRNEQTTQSVNLAVCNIYHRQTID